MDSRPNFFMTLPILVAVPARRPDPVVDLLASYHTTVRDLSADRAAEGIARCSEGRDSPWSDGQGRFDYSRGSLTTEKQYIAQP